MFTVLGPWSDALRRSRLHQFVALVLAAVFISSCQSPDTLATELHADITRTMATSMQFVWTDQELSLTQTVSGQYADAYRYHLLYVANGVPAWEEVVKDDAVADRILDPAAVARYWSTQRANVTIPSAQLAGAALLAHHWVVDTTGAPSVPTVGQEVQEYKDDPFDQALLFLSDVNNLISLAPPPEVRQYRADDVTPVYKPTDDPFPAPLKGSGITRYDVYEQPLPVVQTASPGAVPAPPTISNFTKIAIYVKNGMVVEIRLTTDPIDQLQQLVNNYHLSLPKNLSREGQEAFAQTAIQRLSIQTGTLPFLVRQETLVVEPLPRGTSIAIPSGAVPAKLSFLHPS
ncbi:MAG: hypothetical protein ACYCSJ_01540 [Acidimicrobiales bacterium]